MKIFIYIPLFFLILNIEKRFSEKFYTAVSDFSQYIRAANGNRDKPVTLKKLEHYLTKIDSAIKEIDGFQRRCFCTYRNDVRLYKSEGAILSKSADCSWKVLKWMYAQVKKRIHRRVGE